MKDRQLSFLSVLVLAIEFSYFFVSDGPYIGEGVAASEQLSGGNDDRFILQFCASLFALPVLYGLVAMPFDFRAKNPVAVAVYLLAFTAWAFFVIAVNADTPLWQSLLFGDWYLPAYVAAPFLPVAFMIGGAMRRSDRSAWPREE